MAISTGLALGGATDQINTRKKLGIQRGDLALKQATAEADQRQQLQEDLEERINSTFEFTKNKVDQLSKFVGTDDPRVQRVVERAKQDVVEMAAGGQNLGLSINPRFISRKFDALLVQPSREERLEAKGEESFVTSQASAAGTAAGTPAKPMTVSPGETVIDAQGNVIFQGREKPRTFELSPGERVVDERGNVIAEGGPGDTQEFTAVLEGSDRPVILQKDEQGNFVDPSGNTVDLQNVVSLKKIGTEGSGGLEVITNKEGETIVRTGGAAGGANISGNQADQLQDKVQNLSRAQEGIDELLASEQKLGALATAGKFGRTSIFTLEDVARLFPGVDTAADLLRNRFPVDQLGPAQELFNEDLDDITLLENTLAFALAQTRTDQTRIPVQFVQDAKSDINISGLTSDTQVRNRLKELKTVFQQKIEDTNTRLKDQGIDPIQQGGRLKFNKQGELVND